jgi:hypothetical protein
MAHHVTDENPTHDMSICAATRQIPDGRSPSWFHMCQLPYEHSTVHQCGEPGCDARWSDI